jgi:hypothetical protein
MVKRERDPPSLFAASPSLWPLLPFCALVAHWVAGAFILGF